MSPDWLTLQALRSVEQLRAIPTELQSPVTRKLLEDWDRRLDTELREL